MIDKLRSIAIFSAIVEQGSFRAAARQLGLAPSRVSEIVSGLEADLGVTLLYRSTRHLSLSHEGRLLHEKAQDMLRAAETGLDQINPSSRQPTGSLRVTTPAFVTQTGLMTSFAAFSQTYPGIHLEFHFSDHPSDIIKDGFDLAIRAGWPGDSALMSRTIGQAERVLVASPDYAAKHAKPVHPNDLEDWNWVRFLMRKDQTEMTSPEGEKVAVTGKSSVTVNSAEALYEFAIRGLGVTEIPDHLARKALEREELVQLLPEWSLRPLGLHAVWPGQSRRENLTTLFVRFLAKAVV